MGLPLATEPVGLLAGGLNGFSREAEHTHRILTSLIQSPPCQCARLRQGCSYMGKLVGTHIYTAFAPACSSARAAMGRNNLKHIRQQRGLSFRRLSLALSSLIGLL